jgi:16S rRNA (guanine966-N2)-methyltransferase
VRIIGGLHKGILINPPQGLPVRPTTDRAKESLFNILDNNFNFETIRALDLFSGTGNIAYELCSRGCLHVDAVDMNSKCVQFIKDTKNRLSLDMLTAIRKDAFAFLRSCTETYTLIFADAPYAMKEVTTLPAIIEQRKLLDPEGWLIIEHESNLDLTTATGFFEKRVYGQSAFSFFSTT